MFSGVMSVVSTEYIYRSISSAINVLVGVRKVSQCPKAFMIHQKPLWSRSNSFSLQHQTTAPAVIIPVVPTVLHVAMGGWSLLVPLGMSSLGLCSLVPK